MKRYVLCLCFMVFLSFYCFSETVEFRCVGPDLEYNNHVGNEWSFEVKIAGQNCPLEKKVVIRCSSRFKIHFNVWEADKGGSDFGSNFYEIDLNTVKDDEEHSIDISTLVIENNGRYKGYSAKWMMRIYFRILDDPLEN